MMIASRFRTVAWVAGVAIAALCCYLVSLQVAAERAKVGRLDIRLVAARADIRQLSTELDTRGRLVQLERWNADVLALTAPKADQYLAGEMQLASLAMPAAPAAASTAIASAAIPAATLEAPAAVRQIAYRPILARPSSRLLHSVSLDLDAGIDRAALRAAALVRAGRVGGYLDGKTIRP